MREINCKRIHQKRVSGMGRRRFVKSLLAAGFGTTAASLITVEDVQAAASDQVPIVYAIGPDDPDPSTPTQREKRVKNVPADWYNNLQRAERAHRSLDYENKPGIVSTGVKPGEYGGSSASITVDISTRANKLRGGGMAPNNIGDIRGEIPTQVDDIPIEVTETELPVEGGCNDGDFGENLPTGVACEGSKTSGTLGAPLSRNNALRFCTNHHLFIGNGNQPVGDILYHPSRNSGDAIGRVLVADCKDDIVITNTLNGHNPEPAMHAVEGEDVLHILGQWTKDGLADRKANNGRLEKIGQNTCHTSGDIRNVQANIYSTGFEGCVPRSGQVTWGQGNDLSSGDSGSVSYAPDPEYPTQSLLVASLNAGWYPSTPFTQGFVFGTSAYRIRNQHGHTFGWFGRLH